MLKKIGLLMVLSCVYFGLSIQVSAKELRILTSFYPMYIMAINVTNGVPDVTVQNMTPPLTGCLHDYSLTPKDMKKIESADVLIINGAGMESFMESTLEKATFKVIDSSTGITLTDNNSHLWVSVSRAQKQVKNIGSELAKIDPTHAAAYQKNTNAYLEKLKLLSRDMHRQLAPFKGKAIITFHEAFPYFAEEFGFHIPAVIAHEPGIEPSAKEIRDTIKTIQKHKVVALFAEPQYPGKTAEVIAKETHVPVYTLDPAVTGPDQRDAYLTIMKKNLATLKKALK